MSKLPEYTLNEILSTLARNIIKYGSYYDEDYELLSYVADDFYILKEEVEHD